MEEGAFEGVRVVELAQWVFVPVAGALLADWGADVVRIERPEGDPYRGLATQGIGTDSGGVNMSVALANRGKRSIALDLRNEEGRDVLHQLLETADVFLTNFRPGALRRLGLDAETLTRAVPARSIYARGHGYGVRGPDADHPGYDASAFWARGGMAHVLTPPGPRPAHRPARRDGRPQRRDGAGVRHGGRAAQAHPHRHAARWSTCRCSASRCGRCRPTCSPRSRAQQPRAMSMAERAFVNPLVGVYSHEGRSPHQLGVPRGRSLLGRLLPLVRTAKTSPTTRASSTSRPAASTRRNASTELTAEFASAHVRRMEGAAAQHRRAVGAGAGGRGAARRPAGASPTSYIGDVVVDGEPAYRLPTVPVQFDERTTRAAARARARRALRADPARARVHVGRDRRAAGGRA